MSHLKHLLPLIYQIHCYCSLIFSSKFSFDISHKQLLHKLCIVLFFIFVTSCHSIFSLFISYPATFYSFFLYGFLIFLHSYLHLMLFILNYFLHDSNSTLFMAFFNFLKKILHLCTLRFFSF